MPDPVAGPQHELIPLSDRARWGTALAGVAHGPAHTWEHARAMAASTSGEIFLYRYERDGSVVVCPILERPVEGQCDVVTPLGFNGFAGATDDQRFPDDWRAFAIERQWICAYIALHPAFSNGSAFPASDVTSHNELHLLDLTRSHEDLVAGMSRNRRRQLRDWPTRRDRLVVDRDRVTAFLVETYADFFSRREASAATKLSTETLALIAAMPNTLLVGAPGDDENGLEAVLVVAYTAHCADAVFSVSVPGGERHGAYLNWHAVEQLRAIGIPTFNMGGGVTRNDDVAEFKRRFGATPHPLRAIRQIYDDAAYRRACAVRNVAPGDHHDGFFPVYRG